MSVGTAPAGARATVGSDAVDIGIGGSVVLRVTGHHPADLAAVEAQFGRGGPAGSAPADITIRYVDRLVRRGPLTYLGPGEIGYDDDGFVVLRGRFRSSVRVAIPVADLGGRCEVVCEHGVGRVPHLVALVNLAVLANGGLALHASAFEIDGSTTVVTGWSKGGKSEALLAFCRQGARYVGDEWIHFHPDGGVTGIDEPVRVWDWYLDQVPAARAALARRDRRRLRGLGVAARVEAATTRSDRLATAIRRQRFVDAPVRVVAPHGRVTEPSRVDRVFLMSSGEQPETTVRVVPGAVVADRMAASLAFERRPLLELVDAFRYAFPHEPLPGLAGVADLERRRLHAFLDDVASAEVTHPYPAVLADLHTAMRAAMGADR